MKKCQAEILIDKSNSGRIRPWAEMKHQNIYLAAAYESINLKKAERLKECANWLEFGQNGNIKKLIKANFCRVRLCPMCQWRRSLKNFSQLKAILGAMGTNDYAYLMLTLTIRNCKGEELSKALDTIINGFHFLQKYDEVNKAVIGAYRAVEIVHNIKSDEYHPHIHAVLAVRKSYFNSRDYLSQKRWSELWKKACRIDYVPIVHIKRLKGETAGALAEVAKYACKPGDYIMPEDWQFTENTVALLDKVLNKRRLVSYFGLMKEWQKRLKLSDVEGDGDLVNIDDKDKLLSGLGEGAERVIYYFSAGYKQYIRG